MTFDGEYFQQIFGLFYGNKCGTHLYKYIHGNAGKWIKSEVQNWPQTNLADSIQTVYWWWLGDRKEVFHWIQKFNELRKNVQIDKYNWGTALDYTDLFIYKSNSFYLDGKLSISSHQKVRLISLWTSLFISFHQQYTIKNIVWGKALCALQYGGENFQKTQISIVSKFAQSIMSLRNMSTPNYSNTSHIRKGINYSIQNFLFLMFVNHLLVRK